MNTATSPDTPAVSGDVSRPNVIVVCIDTLRADHVTPTLTPNLWRIARRGVRLPRAWAEFPLTVPFRVSAVTGTYTFTNRPWSGLRRSDRHLAEMCSASGYDTAAFTDTPFRSDVGLDRGFDTFVELPSKLRAVGPPRPIEWVGPTPFIAASRDDDRGRWRNFRDGWLPRRRGEIGEPVGIEALVDHSLEWLRRDRTRPGLLWLDSFQCHEPWLSPDDERRASSGPWPFERFLPLPSGPDDAWMDDGDRAQVRSLYAGEVAHTDRHIGRLVDHLDVTNAWDDTVVVVMSDHGVPLGEHGRIRKYDVPLYDEMARIPWIIAAPGCRAGTLSDTPVQTPDLLATLVDLLSLKVPPSEAYGPDVEFPGGLEGHSLLPVLQGESGTRQQAFLGVFGTRQAIVRWPYKAIDFRGERPDELFDLSEDPSELRDLASELPDVLGELRHASWRFQHRWARALRRL